MYSTRHHDSRYLHAARRVALKRLLAAGALVALPAACSSGDESAFSSAATATSDTESSPSSDAVTPVSGSSATTQPATTQPATTEPVTTNPATTVGTDATGATGSDATFPAGAELVVDFTYTAESGGRVNNPYIAVWVEDAEGNLVQTISLWYQQDAKGQRWLNELRSWYSAAADSTVTTSGATRSAGSYSVVWDGTDVDGNLVAAGEYTLYVEAAREHGPYEITSTPITIGDAGFSVTLPDNGELSALSASLSV